MSEARGTVRETAWPASTRLRMPVNRCSPRSFSFLSSSCISETDFPFEDFMNPKKALEEFLPRIILGDSPTDEAPSYVVLAGPEENQTQTNGHRVVEFDGTGR